MNKDLFNHFERFIKLSPELKTELQNRLKYQIFNKGDLVHHANDICRTSYFIQKGLLRIYFIKNSKEISEYFSSEAEWVNSPRSFMQQKKDIYFIDALETTEVYSIDVVDLVYLFDHFSEMERYSRLSMGIVFGHYLERITSMRFSTAKEKYEHFITIYHDIYHRIPLGMLASYLGITQETLSRIRAQK
jgi:CRP-like cAMP-binding protein